MEDNYISRSAAFAGLLWAAAVILVLATWVIVIVDVPPRWTAATGVTAVFAMAGATICQMRLYTLRLCGLIRISAGLETPDASVRHMPVRS